MSTQSNFMYVSFGPSISSKVQCVINSQDPIDLVECNFDVANDWIPFFKCATEEAQKAFIDRIVNMEHMLDKSGTRILNVACVHSGIPVVEYLIQKGANVNLLDDFGETALHDACKMRKISMVRFLVNSTNINIDQPNNKGRTALGFLCEDGQTELAKLFLEKGADIEIIDKDGFSILDRAANSSPEMVNLISQHLSLKHIETLSSDGFSPFHRICKNATTDSIRLLIDRGINLTKTSATGMTPLQLLCENSKVTNELIKQVVDKGISLDFDDKEIQKQVRDRVIKAYSYTASSKETWPM